MLEIVTCNHDPQGVLRIMEAAQSVKQVTQELIAPLCDETRQMFRELHIPERDRLKIKLQGDDLKQFRVECIHLTESGEEYPGSYNSRVRFCTMVPGHTMVSSRYTTFDVTDLTCLLIAYHWAPIQLLFESDAARDAYNYRIANFIKQTYRLKDRQELNGFQYLDSKVLPLSNYQKLGLKASINQESFGLFMEQGTGKTPLSIARMCNEAAKKYSEESDIYRTLIICPSAVCINWKEEIKKFASIPGRTTVIDGTNLARRKKLIDAMKAARDQYNQYTASIISMDSVHPTLDVLKIVPWDLCILDESHNIKDHRTKRWSAMKELRNSCRQRMVLTGTPIANSLFDLWTQFEFMGEGWSGFSSFSKFRKFYGNFAKANPQAQHGYEKLVAIKNLPMIQERLARQAFLIKKKDALPELPEKMYDIHQVEMTKDQLVAYRSLSETLAVEIEGILSTAEAKKEVMVVKNILAMMLRLSQITSGFLGIPPVVNEYGIVEQEGRINRFDPNPKVEALVEILKEKDSHQKTLIWTNYVQNIKTMKARLALEGIKAVTYYGEVSKTDRLAAVKAFNEDPETKVFIGNPAAGGTGLNLLGYPIGLPEDKVETYCDHVIYYSQDWSAINRAQSEDRPHRRGTVCHVRYTDLVVPNTIDEEIRLRVLDKRISALRIQDVRKVLARITGKEKTGD